MSENLSPVTVKAVCDGEIIPIADVPDQVFSKKLIGDGIAINPESNDILSPVTGRVIQLADTLHVITVETQEGIKIMIHVGLDTVMLKGEGFTAYVQEGDQVTVGENLLSFDRQKISEQFNPIVSIVCVGSQDQAINIVYTEERVALAGETALFTALI